MTNHTKGWNPDEVAPPIGDVYQREARASEWLRDLVLLAFGVVVALAVIGWVL